MKKKEIRNVIKMLLISKHSFLLFCVFIIAFTLRFYNLSIVPYSFHEDEMSNTYIGRYILQNGEDLHKQKWPLFYSDKFGDYPPVLPMYLSGLSTLIFGVNKLAARIPTAFIGALSIFLLYLLGLYIFKDRKVALLSSFVLAAMPWHIVFSRSAAEGILALFSFSIGLFFLLKWLKMQRRTYIIIVILFFGLTYFLYPSFRVLIPLFLAGTPLIMKLKGRALRLIMVVITIFFLLTVLIGTTTWGRARYKQTAIFGSKGSADQVAATLTALSNDEGQNNVIKARIFHNKVVGYSRKFVKEYLSYYNPLPLFVTSAHPYRYYPLSEHGYLYVSFLALGVIGLLTSFRNIKRRSYYLLLYLLAIAAIPAALTVDFTPHYHRFVVAIIPISLFVAYGWKYLHSVYLWKKLSLGVLAWIIILFEFVYFWHQYSIHSKSFQTIYRNDTFEEVILDVVNKKSMYDYIIMPGEEKLPVYYLFFTNNFTSDVAGKFYDNLYIESIDNILFKNTWCPSEEVNIADITKQTLIIDQGDCKDREGLREINVIYRADNTRGFRYLITDKDSMQ